jgi:hypothetical protein
LAAAIHERKGVMNDGVWKEMRDKEGGQEESDQEKITKDIGGTVTRPFYSVRENRRLLLVYLSCDDGGLTEFIFYPPNSSAAWISLCHSIQMSLILCGIFLFTALLN